MLATSVATQTAASVTTAVAIFDGLTPPANCIGFVITPTDGSLWWGDSGLTAIKGLPLGGLQDLRILTSAPNSFYVMAQGSSAVNVRRAWIINDQWGALA